MITKVASLVAEKAGQRRIEVLVSNTTGLTLRLQHANTHGRFNPAPPATIAPGGSGPFGAENVVEGQGCDYDVVYETSLNGDLHQLTFSGVNPWVGHADYTEIARTPLTVRGHGGQGQIAERAVVVKQDGQKA